MPKSSRRSKTPAKRPLPGDLGGHALVERVLRVDHAGEYGAKRIYEGQLAVLGDTETGAVIRAMADNEAEHLAWFDRALNEAGARPTALYPVWHVAGYALGVATALMGPKAAMACTVAVEEAIDEHYTRQEATLGTNERTLKSAVMKFHKDELAHRDTALAHDAEATPGYELISGAIKTGARLAIWLSERI